MNIFQMPLEDDAQLPIEDTSLPDTGGPGKKKKASVQRFVAPPAELTPSGAAPLTSVTTATKSGVATTTQKRPTPTRKKDLTADEYFNPDTPTYNSGDIGLNLLGGSNSFLTKMPIIGEYIKKMAIEQESKPGSLELDILAAHPWLMNVPILSDYIKDKAFRIASTGSGTVKSGESIARGDMKTTDGAMDYKDWRHRLDLLRHYIYADQNLPNAPFTPSDDYYKFLPTYSLREKLGSSKINDAFSNMMSIANRATESTSKTDSFLQNSFAGTRNLNTQRYKGLISDLNTVIKTGQPVFYNGTDNTPKNIPLKLFYDAIPDLGHYKSGFAMDKELKLPFAFVADAWDFYPKDYEKFWNQDVDHNNPEEYNKKEANTSAYQQAFLLHKAGKPYKIYERTYFDPETKQVIPQEEILKRKEALKK